MNEMKRSADYTPSQGAYTPITPFRYFCQKVLPLVYDDSLSYYELLCKVVNHLNTVINNTNGLQSDVTNLYNAFVQLQQYVNTYFDSLDIQTEVDKKLDEMAADGSLAAVFTPTVADIAQPKVVTSISQMTNDKYTYVLQSTGHMYQYQNGNWVDTGLVLGGEADGLFGIKPDTVTNLNAITTAGIFYHTSSDAAASNTPNDAVFANTKFMVISYYKTVSDNFQMFFSKDLSETYIRHQIGGGNWSAWVEINTTANTLANPNLNNINASGVSYHASTGAAATNTPNDALYGQREFMVINYKLAGKNWQLFYDYRNQIIFVRNKLTASTWTTWSAVAGDHRFLPYTDLDQISISGCFLHANVDNAAAHTPNEAYINQTFMLESHAFGNSINYQAFYPYNVNTCYIRTKINERAWGEWVSVNTTGNKLPDTDLNNIKISGALFHESGDALATNTPNDAAYENGNFMLVNYFADNQTKHYQLFFEYALATIWFRVRKTPTSFTPWKELTGGGDDGILVTQVNELEKTVDLGKFIVTIRHDTDSNTSTDTYVISKVISKSNNAEFVSPSRLTGYITSGSDTYGASFKNEKFSSIYFYADGEPFANSGRFSAFTMVLTANIIIDDVTFHKTTKITFSKNKIKITFGLTASDSGVNVNTIECANVGFTNTNIKHIYNSMGLYPTTVTITTPSFVHTLALIGNNDIVTLTATGVPVVFVSSDYSTIRFYNNIGGTLPTTGGITECEITFE